jgi:membrane fusion protein (multidrug efflux system)
MSRLTYKTKIYVIAPAAVLLVGLSVAFASQGWHAVSQTTDDAFVSADFSVIAPRVEGQVASLAVEDNQVVRKGQLLLQVDESGYLAAVAAAEANVAAAKATIDNVAAALLQQQSVIEQADAAWRSAQANVVFAQADVDRYDDLASHGAGSRQNAQQARSRIDTARATLAREDAGRKAARQQVAILEAQREHGEAAQRQADAALVTARLHLAWTHIVAPIDGVVGQRAVRVGGYVTPGTPLLAIVPLEQAYVIANFQETQLTHVRPGQAVDIRVDSYPDRAWQGEVDSFAPATGVTFAAIAPDNATGNFTKVVQRIPVKIRLAKGQRGLDALRVGMSVDATIHTGTHVDVGTEGVAAR